ncbi:HAD family hydrolase [Candidatus Saccharibacteria bacterium]|nr:MAG: HAD family hydrolase [Candidatus Saccharibacteria bacterium]
MKQIKAVINDIDGNLTLTEEACWHLENEVYAQLGVAPIDRALHKQTWGMKLDDALSIRSAGKIDAVTFWRLFSPLYDTYVTTGRLDSITPENMSVLRELHEMGLVNMLLTSRIAAEMTHYLVPSHALYEYVDAVYYKDNMEYHKPDPRAPSLI